MKPVVMFRHKGFLIRVVDNGAKVYPYEWTINGITPKTKRMIREDALRRKTYHKQIASMRKWEPRHDEWRLQYSRKRRLGNKLKRVYDPTSMPTARGRSYGAQAYAYNAVKDMLTPQKPYCWFNVARTVK